MVPLPAQVIAMRYGAIPSGRTKLNDSYMDINDNSALKECTSCQMCGAVCAQNAITIKLNEDGFYRPYVDEYRCTNCGLCTKVCYKFDAEVKVTTPAEEDKIEVRSAQNKSDMLLKKVTSGGVADALAKELIMQGFTCIGVTYNDSLHRAEHTVATTTEDTDAFRGSKYIQSYSIDALKELVKNARTTKFAVFGLPCHIYAVHKFLIMRKLRDNCVLVDLFCHGCPSMLVWNKYEQDIKNRVGSKRFDDVQFRSKVKGWGAYHISVNIDGKEAFVSTPKNDEFYSLFFSDMVLNDACADCKLRSTMEYTDIRLGDFWGKKFQNDRKGVSAVAVVTERGKQLFDAIKDKFLTEDSTMKEVLLKQSYGKVYTPNLALRKTMLEALRDETISLKKIEKLYYSKQGLVPNLKRLIKVIDWYLPFDLTRFLKRFA